MMFHQKNKPKSAVGGPWRTAKVRRQVVRSKDPWSRLTSPSGPTARKSCLVCFSEETDSDQLLLFCHHHHTCNLCLRTYLETEILSGKYAHEDLRCPSPGCNHRFSLKELEQLTSSATYSKMKAWRQKDLDDQDIWRVCCPSSSCATVFRLDPQQQHATCPKCSHGFCRQCMKTPHEGLEICPLVKDSLLFQEWVNQINQSQAGGELLVRQCECGIFIEKRLGCNHMHCMGCGRHFCWRCGQDLSGHNHVVCNSLYQQQRRTHTFAGTSAWRPAPSNRRGGWEKLGWISLSLSFLIRSTCNALLHMLSHTTTAFIIVLLFWYLLPAVLIFSTLKLIGSTEALADLLFFLIGWTLFIACHAVRLICCTWIGNACLFFLGWRMFFLKFLKEHLSKNGYRSRLWQG